MRWDAFIGLCNKIVLRINTGNNSYVTIEQNRSPDHRAVICGSNAAKIRAVDPPIEHPLSTHPALIRRWSGKFSSQLKFAGWSADSWGNYAIRRWPPGRRPNIWRWPVGHRPIFLGKIMPKIGRSPPGHRGIIPWWLARRSDGDPSGDLPAA